jgi:chloramphenicol-sensitive protein RarD
MEPIEADGSAGQRRRPSVSVAYALSAYFIWGLSPLYWKTLKLIPSLEITCHRIVWSLAFLIPVVLLGGRRKELIRVLTNPGTMMILLTTALLVGGNWLLYIWAVNNEHVLQASLGYYINPLVSISLGIIFLRERMSRLQGLAVVLACGGVVYLTLHYGQFPTVSLLLAFSFGFYGLIRKVAPVSALTGLTVESLILTLPALVYLAHLSRSGKGAFGQQGITTDLLLVGACLVTALPLLLFTMAARRLNLSTMGFLQYIAPTCMFFLGVFLYHEPFTLQHAVTFLLIWTALAIYSADSLAAYRRSPGLTDTRRKI